MIRFFEKNSTIYAVESNVEFSAENLEKLVWLFGGAKVLDAKEIQGDFIGPRREMITPWSTNAVEITQNMGIEGIVRIEEFVKVSDANAKFDPMLNRKYPVLDQNVYTVETQPAPIVYIDDLRAYNVSEGLALSDKEIEYLEEVAVKLGRSLTDS